MSHLQKAFIAKNKGHMHKQPQRRTRGMIMHEANRVTVKTTKEVGCAPIWMCFIAAPEYLHFTLRK
jgi:hypothetical protein